MDNDTIDLWLPSSLDPSTLPGNGERPARIAYLAHLLTCKPYGKSGFVRLNKQLLRQTISDGAERAALDHLKPFIEIDGSYKPGLKSKGYRWTEHYQDDCATKHSFTCPRLADRLNNYDVTCRHSYTEIERALDADMKHIGLPVDLDKFLQKLPPKASVKSEQHRKNVILASGDNIQRGQTGIISTSEKTGRLHCSVNRLCSHLREHLVLCGEPVLEIDLSSSQPYFLASLFPSQALVDAVSAGQFYSRVNEELDTPVNLTDTEAYGEFKMSILSILYARPINGHDYTQSSTWKHRKSLLALNDAYPGIIDFIQTYRTTHGDTALPIALNKLESSVFIDGVLMKLQSLGIPAVPIHDSILCRVSDSVMVEGLIYDELMASTGITPNLKLSKAS